MSTLQMTVPATALGSRAARAAALLLDGLIVGVPIVALSAAAGSSGTAGIAVLWLLASVLYAPMLLARHGEHNGQTLGKQALGLRVVTTAGVPVTFGVGVKRQLLGQTLIGLFTFGFYYLIDYAWPLWDERKQALHDKIATTYVFSADADPALARQLGTPLTSPAIPAAPVVPPPPPPT